MIRYTKHALENLVKRKISKNKVRKCLENPDIKSSGTQGKTLYLKDYGKNFLKVVVSEEEGDQIVITQHWLDKKRVKG